MFRFERVTTSLNEIRKRIDIQSLCRLIPATGLTCTTSGQCPWFFTISQISSCMKKITVWSTLVWKITNKQPGWTAGKIRSHPFFARNQDMFVEKPPGILITHQIMLKLIVDHEKGFQEMFWCKIRSKCALVSHIHAPKVGQFLSAGNQVQVSSV